MTVHSSASDFVGKTLDNGRIRLVEKLGEGSYGTVYRAVDYRPVPGSSSSNCSVQKPQYAVKILQKGEAGSKLLQYQQREIALHNHVTKHRNVVAFYGHIEDDDFMYVFMEYCSGGDLFAPIIDRGLYAGDDALVRMVLVQLLDAVQYCHDRGVYHRDIKLDNILTNEDGTEVKIADFGLSTSSPTSESFGCGSLPYMSPECIGVDCDYQPYSTRAADIWSLAVVFINIIAGCRPWVKATFADLNFRSFVLDPSYLRQILPLSEDAAEIIQGMLDPEPATRMGIPEARRRVLAVRTFFMSHEEIAQGGPGLRDAAAMYLQRPKGLFCPSSSSSSTDSESSEAHELAMDAFVAYPNKSMPLKEAYPAATPVIAPDLLSASSSTGESFGGPTTPPTRAKDSSKPLDFSELAEKEVGEATIPEVRKGRSEPVTSSPCIEIYA